MILRLLLLALLSGGLVASPVVLDADKSFAAATKKKKGLKKRSEYTAEQREKIFENARKICKKKFGAPSNVNRVDYTTGIIWCNPL